MTLDDFSWTGPLITTEQRLMSPQKCYFSTKKQAGKQSIAHILRNQSHFWVNALFLSWMLITLISLNWGSERWVSDLGLPQGYIFIYENLILYQSVPLITPRQEQSKNIKIKSEFLSKILLYKQRRIRFSIMQTQNVKEIKQIDPIFTKIRCRRHLHVVKMGSSFQNFHVQRSQKTTLAYHSEQLKKLI